MGINAIARSGSQLASGDVKAAASTLGESWVSDFSKATEDLSFNEGSRSSRASVLSALSNLQSSASRGNLADAKKGFVATVSALQSWVAAADLSESLKGI